MYNMDSKMFKNITNFTFNVHNYFNFAKSSICYTIIIILYVSLLLLYGLLNLYIPSQLYELSL